MKNRAFSPDLIFSHYLHGPCPAARRGFDYMALSFLEVKKPVYILIRTTIIPENASKIKGSLQFNRLLLDDYRISICVYFTPHVFASSREGIQISAFCQYRWCIRSSTMNILLPKCSGKRTLVPIGRKFAAMTPL